MEGGGGLGEARRTAWEGGNCGTEVGEVASHPVASCLAMPALYPAFFVVFPPPIRWHTRPARRLCAPLACPWRPRDAPRGDHGVALWRICAPHAPPGTAAVAGGGEGGGRWRWPAAGVAKLPPSPGMAARASWRLSPRSRMPQRLRCRCDGAAHPPPPSHPARGRVQDEGGYPPAPSRAALTLAAGCLARPSPPSPSRRRQGRAASRPRPVRRCQRSHVGSSGGGGSGGISSVDVRRAVRHGAQRGGGGEGGADARRAGASRSIKRQKRNVRRCSLDPRAAGAAFELGAPWHPYDRRAGRRGGDKTPDGTARQLARGSPCAQLWHRRGGAGAAFQAGRPQVRWRRPLQIKLSRPDPFRLWSSSAAPRRDSTPPLLMPHLHDAGEGRLGPPGPYSLPLRMHRAWRIAAPRLPPPPTGGLRGAPLCPRRQTGPIAIHDLLPHDCRDLSRRPAVSDGAPG